MQEISVTGTFKTQHITSSMAPSYTGAPETNIIHKESVPMIK